MNTQAIYVCAPNDRNGNPRRGWLITERNLTYWEEEGYGGAHGVARHRGHYLLPILEDAHRINVTATEYNRLRKQYR